MRKSPQLRILFVALGFTTLFLLWVIAPAVDSSQDAFYHWSGTAGSFFLPIALDFLLFWLILVLLLWAARTQGRLRIVIWSGLLLLTPWIFLCSVRLVYLPSINRRLLGSLLLATGLLLCALIPKRWRRGYTFSFERIVAGATTILIFAGMFGGFLLCRLAWYGWQARNTTNKYSQYHPQTSVATQPHRIIWIIFDELSYEQVYERRFPGLQLPAFDSLAKQSTLFTQAFPSNISTENVLLGLISGTPVDQIRSLDDGQLSIRNATSGKWQMFNEHDTVFSDALNAGYSTGVAGWYNPYCRILPDVLKSCYWTYRSPSGNQMLPSETILSNTLAFPRMVLNSLTKMLLTYCSSTVQNFVLAKFPFLSETRKKHAEVHIKDYQDLYAASDKLLRDRSMGLTLLHLPIPHPGGIYSRVTGKLTKSPSTYVDNLVLTDKCLANLRAILEQTGQWNSSIIIVMGDHSWRTTQVWRPNGTNWSREEEQASHGGQYDPRPVYIVKLANQTAGIQVDKPLPTIDSRKLIDRVLAHTINTPADLSAWAGSLR